MASVEMVFADRAGLRKRRTGVAVLVALVAAALSMAGPPRHETRGTMPARQTGAPVKASGPRVRCKTPEIAASCSWVHGRLSFYNGNPSYRLWKIGTHRMIGIYSGPSVNGHNFHESDVSPDLPANVEQALKSLSTDVFGDFEICPLEAEQPGVMQAACIESAKNLVPRPIQTRP